MSDYAPPTSGVNTPPRPSVCPSCGLGADNGVVTRAEVTATATYLDTAGHMWSVTWLEVA